MDDVVRHSASAGTRVPAVAGLLYPADPVELAQRVAALLEGSSPAGSERAPKALLVPHGAFRHSGVVAAAAFRTIAAAAPRIRRVILVGPLHRLSIAGLVLPEAGALATPLGEVPVDADALACVLALPEVTRSDLPHRREHALEVQLPFLPVLLHDFTVLPILVGEVCAGRIAEALELVWGGPETLVVATSDLSLHRPYAEALVADAETARRIVRLDASIDPQAACGSSIIAGLLHVAARRGLDAVQLCLANSGDSGGDPARVVGYGSFGFYPGSG
jgi:MEMO1 family protein